MKQRYKLSEQDKIELMKPSPSMAYIYSNDPRPFEEFLADWEKKERDARKRALAKLSDEDKIALG